MLTKVMIVGAIDIQEDGRIGVREDTVVSEDGVELARTYHRRVLEPGTDLSTESDQRLLAVAGGVWTPDVVTAFSVAAEARKSADAVRLKGA